ncbi:MAG: lipocalin-like domain-containing protein [Longimicrobiales bacterium]|nr:lipocalin-like domain-containing protein [Longimicrobiales bacterium]
MVNIVRGPLVAVAFLLFGCSGVADAPRTPGPLEGVWSVAVVEPEGAPPIDPAQPGMYIFTADHYSAVYTPGPEPRSKAATSFQPTPEEMVDQFQSIIVNAGRYEIDGASITFRPIIARSPGFVGGRLTGAFDVSGDTLTLRHERLFDQEGAELSEFGERLTLVRIE